MDFKVCLLFVVVCVFRGCYTETINVGLPSNPPPVLIYTLGMDPIDRKYICLNTSDNNSNTIWNDAGLNNLGPVLDIYSFYKEKKMKGEKVFKCYTNINRFLGVMMVDIVERGHIIVTQDNISKNYSSNEVIEVSENSQDVTITCSSHTGALLRDDRVQSFPSVTISKVTLQHNNNVYRCQRKIGGTVLFEVTLTLSVLPDPTNATTTPTATTSATPETANTTTMSTTTPTTVTITSPTITTTDANTATSESTPTNTTTPQTTTTTNTTIPEATTNTTIPEATTNTTIPVTTPIITTIPVTTASTTPTPTLTTEKATIVQVSTTTPETTPGTTPETTTTTTTSETTPETTAPVITTVTTASTTPTPTQTEKPTIVQVTTTTPETTPEATTETTTTTTPAGGLAAEPVVILTTLFLITVVICGVVTVVCLFVCCCCCLRDKPNKHEELGHCTDPPDVTTDTLRSLSKEDPTLSPYKTDGDSLSLSIVPSDFKERMNQLWEQECDQLVEEYNSLGGAEMRYSADTAVLPTETVKNRYKNILPYDRSRVVLTGGPEGTGYINASHIPGILIPQSFISSQGPKENTVQDFWRMLWEHSVRHLVMLTKLVERGRRKCEQYWPERVGDGEHRGDLFVTLVNLVTEDMWTMREMMVRNSAGEKRVVKQMQFTGWPDFEAPKHPRDLILFLQRVKLEVSEDRSVICVHCSAGVGRSGTFIALYNLMEQTGDGSSINIWNVVNEMREHRPFMVQAWAQYRFLYLAVLELIQGDTCVQAGNFPHHFQFRLQTHSPLFTTQFHELEFQSEKTFAGVIERAFDVDAVNPDTMTLPYNDTRVVLQDTTWDGSDYINASYVEGYSGGREFIATQLPVSDSVRDFMQLIYQTRSPVVVLLASYAEFHEMSYDEGRIRYWPVPMTQHEFAGYTLKNENTFIHPLFNKMRLANEEQGEEHDFTLVTLLDWTEEGEFGTTVDCLQRLFQATELIERSQEEHAGRPIIVQCRDGSGATGVFIAALNSIGQIKSGGDVDIFQTAKRMRACRQCMVSSLEQYISVHFIVSAYLRGQEEDPPTPTAPYLSSL